MIRLLRREQLRAAPEPLSTAVSTPAPERATPQGAEVLYQSVTRALIALLSEELALKPEHIRSVVDRELSRAMSAERVLVRVHPADLALLKPAAELRARLELRAEPELKADPDVERGGCLVTTTSGDIDAELSTRLALLLAGWKAKGAP